MAKPGLMPINEQIRLAMIGDGTAFTRLWDTYVDALKAYLRGSFNNLDDFYLDDICSRSFEKAFRQIASYDQSKGQFITWLKVIAHNTALDALDQEQRIQRGMVHLDDTSQTVSGIQDEVESALDSIITTEYREQTTKCIEGLPELYRDVARLRLLDGLPYKEIADETGLELNTVRTRIRRAKMMVDKMKEENNNIQ